MRIGLMYGLTVNPKEDSVDTAVAFAKRVEASGFSTLWVPHIFSWDAINLLGMVGRETERIELGTAVVPTYPRHPMALAQQALTTAAACGGRFTLGIGLSHQPVIESMYGYSYAQPARHMKEYLEVLTPLLRGEPVQWKGEVYQTQGSLSVPTAPAVPLVVAALGKLMLGHAGRMADGTITWMTGVKTLGNHIAPTIRAAAEKAGRDAPRVIAGLPIALTNDVAGATEVMGKVWEMYGGLASYRAMLDREGVTNPAEIALVGDEKALRARIAQLRDAGVTDFDAAITPVDKDSVERTLAFLASEC